MSYQTFTVIFDKAAQLRRTLGARTAAGFLRNKGVPLNAALLGLGFPVRFHD